MYQILGDALPTNERQIVFKNGTLVLKNISPFDNGNYTCSVHQGNWVAKQEVSVHVRGNLQNFFFCSKTYIIELNLLENPSSCPYQFRPKLSHSTFRQSFKRVEELE